MKYAFVTLALVAAAQAQSRSDIPECAIPCLDKAIESETSCNIKDYVCVCENFSKVRGIATTCVIEKCGADVAVNKVLPATEALCENPKDESGGSSDKETSVVSAPAATVTTGTTTVAAETETVDETATAVETTTVAVDTTTVAVDTTTVPVVPEVSTTLVVIPPITPNATTGTPSATGGAATPSESVVVDNGAAVLTGLGGIAMVALAALAL